MPFILNVFLSILNPPQLFYSAAEHTMFASFSPAKIKCESVYLYPQTPIHTTIYVYIFGPYNFLLHITTSYWKLYNFKILLAYENTDTLTDNFSVRPIWSWNMYISGWAMKSFRLFSQLHPVSLIEYRETGCICRTLEWNGRVVLWKCAKRVAKLHK